MRKLSYWLTGIAIFFVVVLLIVLLGDQKAIPYDIADNACFGATIADDGGVDTTSSFQINFDEKISAARVRQYLTVSPEIDLGIHQGSSSEQVLIVPAEPLDEDTVYHFLLATDDSNVEWSIQTKGDLLVSSSQPSDKSTGVAVDNSIDLYLNYGIKLDNEKLNDYFTISPAVSGIFVQNGRCLSFQPDKPLSSGQVYTVRLKKGAPTVNSSLTLMKSYKFAFETANSDNSKLVSDWDITTYRQPFAVGQLPNFNYKSDKKYSRDLDLTIYSYKTADDFANALITYADNVPYWSFGGQHNITAVTNGLQTVFNESASVIENNITLSKQLQVGWYLLKAQKGNETRYVYFQVNNISAYWQADDENLLVWAHDAADKPAQGLSVSKFSASGNNVKTDANGLAILKQDYTAPAAFIVSNGDSKLVLYDDGSKQTQESQSTNVWRYLYLDGSSYHSDDTVNFWGMLLPRDGSKLKYQRVSAIVVNQDNSHRELLHEYAPLKNNIFSGSIVLPSLSKGNYQLQIWQSGKQLISRNFSVGEKMEAAITKTNENSQAGKTQLQLNKSWYSIDQDITATLPGVSGKTLFISAANGIKAAVVNDQPVYSAKFSSNDLPGYYLSAVAYKDGKYYPSIYQYLEANSSDYQLNLNVSTNKTVYQSGDTVKINISASGEKLPDQLYALVSVGDYISSKNTNIAEAIYGDAPSLGLNGSAETTIDTEQSADNSGYSNNQFFKQITIKNGAAQTDFVVKGGGDKVITIKYIGFDQQIVAGEVTKTISVNQPFTVAINARNYYIVGDKPSLSVRTTGVKDSDEVEYTLEINSINGLRRLGFLESDKSFRLPLGRLAKGEYSLNLIAKKDDKEYISSAQFIVYDQSQTDSHQASLFRLSDEELKIAEDTQLAVFSSFERCRTLQTLWLSSGILDGDAVSRFAAAHADILLDEYGGSYFENSLSADQNLSKYQTVSGGISESPEGEPELKLSALVASIGNDSISNQALIDYFYSIVNSKAASEKKLIALAGLSTLGESVLNELQLYYKNANTLTADEKLWLAWGLIGCGDKHNAKECLALINDKELKNNSELTIMAAMVSAYCAPISQYSDFIDQMDQYSDYAEAIDSDRQTNALERVLAARGIFSRLDSGDGSCNYQINSSKDNVKLNKGGDLLLALSPKEQRASFNNVNGDICLLLLSSRLY